MVLLASNFDKSRFFKAADIDGERKFRIKSVSAEYIGSDKENKLVVWFTNDERGLALNKTNIRALRGAFGDVVDAWIGKVIVIFQTMTDFRGDMKPGLRVRILPPKQAVENDHSAVLKPEQSTDPRLLEPAVNPANDDLDDEINW